MQFKAYAAGTEYNFSLDKVPADKRDAVLAYLVGYGLNQCGQDAGASETKDEHGGNVDAARKARAKAALARWTALEKGEVPTGGGGRSADPEASGIRALLLAFRGKAKVAYKADAVPAVKEGAKVLRAFMVKHHAPNVVAAINAALAIEAK